MHLNFSVYCPLPKHTTENISIYTSVGVRINLSQVTYNSVTSQLWVRTFFSLWCHEVRIISSQWYHGVCAIHLLETSEVTTWIIISHVSLYPSINCHEQEWAYYIGEWWVIPHFFIQLISTELCDFVFTIINNGVTTCAWWYLSCKDNWFLQRSMTHQIAIAQSIMSLSIGRVISWLFF